MSGRGGNGAGLDWGKTGARLELGWGSGEAKGGVTLGQGEDKRECSLVRGLARWSRRGVDVTIAESSYCESTMREPPRVGGAGAGVASGVASGRTARRGHPVTARRS